MGASDWHYTVAYQPDVKAALQQLRRDVYDRGEYYREPADNDLAMTEDEFRARLDPRGENDGLNDAIVEDWLERKNLPMPSDPDTLLAAQPHSGTHSIIDIANGVSDHPRFGTVSALTDEELREAFGTTAPHSSQVQEWIRSGLSTRDKWVGTYVISYRNGEPDYIHFSGYSGD